MLDPHVAIPGARLLRVIEVRRESSKTTFCMFCMFRMIIAREKKTKKKTH